MDENNRRPRFNNMKVRNCTTTEQYSEFISEAKLVLVMFGWFFNYKYNVINNFCTNCEF